jgi:hypothetical protein
MALVLRTTKGSKLTIAEGDGNFEYLQYLTWDVKGWERYFDTVYTPSNKRTLTASIDNTVTIDGVTKIITQKPTDSAHSAFWSGNKIRTSNDGDTLDIRFDFKASISNASGFFKISVNVGGEIGKIVINTYDFPGGSNTEQDFSILYKLYTGSTFIDNGGEIIIEPSHTMSIWNQSIFVEKGYHGR